MDGADHFPPVSLHPHNKLLRDTNVLPLTFQFPKWEFTSSTPVFPQTFFQLHFKDSVILNWESEHQMPNPNIIVVWSWPKDWPSRASNSLSVKWDQKPHLKGLLGNISLASSVKNYAWYIVGSLQSKNLPSPSLLEVRDVFFLGTNTIILHIINI